MLFRRLAIVLAGFGVAIAVATSASAYTAETTDNVNVRTGPGIRYGILFALPAGSPVEVGGCQPAWCWIDTGGGTGWVSATFLTGGYDGGPEPLYRPYRPYGPAYHPPAFFFGFGYHRGPAYGPYWR